jgi:hypothetical protein
VHICTKNTKMSITAFMMWTKRLWKNIWSIFMSLSIVTVNWCIWKTLSMSSQILRYGRKRTSVVQLMLLNCPLNVWTFLCMFWFSKRKSMQLKSSTLTTKVILQVSKCSFWTSVFSINSFLTWMYAEIGRKNNSYLLTVPFNTMTKRPQYDQF